MRTVKNVARLVFLPGKLLTRWIDLRKARNRVSPLNKPQRGAVHALLAFVAFVALLAVTAPPTSTARTSTVASPSSYTTTVDARDVPLVQPQRVEPQRGAPVVPHPPIAGQAVTVVRVIDGDTFELSDGRKVRVLGIDSCEMSTPAGADAKAAAERLLRGTVYLLTEPGVTTDRYDRLLRYVQTSAGDLGTEMVGGTHTGVYDGKNDASPTYVSKLRSLNGTPARVCGDEEPTVAPKPEPKPVDKPKTADVDKPKPKASGPFKNCAAARAAGAAPVRTGDSGYSRKLDRDGDGVGCE